jgi:hypothetical protein
MNPPCQQHCVRQHANGAVRLHLITGALLFILLTCRVFPQPAQEVTFVLGYAGPSRLVGLGPAASVSSAQRSLGFDYRIPMPASGWYMRTGFELDEFTFSSSAGELSPLRSVSAPLGVEFFQGGEPVAGLSLQPGFYYGQRLTRHAFDLAVQMASGIPLGAKLHGVAGFSNARFYHHALPIFGLIWQPTPQWHFDALYPEPQLVFVPREGVEWRLGGNLRGGGFLGESPAGPARVEYSSYRVGLTWIRKKSEGWSSSLGVGAEVMRNFDYYQQDRRAHGAGSFYVELQLSWQSSVLGTSAEH